jgi:hypothetical protein
MYFDPEFKVKRVSKSLWDFLPQDVTKVIRDFERKHYFAERIQRHWHKVRYAPGTEPEPIPGEGHPWYRTNCWVPDQQVIMFFGKYGPPRFFRNVSGRTWDTGWIIKEYPDRKTKYTSRIRPDNFDPRNYCVYWYSQKSREARYIEGRCPIRSLYEPKHVTLIKPW